jgi:hypothetical protein
MKLFTTITLSLTSFTLAGSIIAVEEPKSIDALIVQLSSDTYKARELASHQLWQLGEEGLAQLRVVVGSDDPEQVKRAEVLIRNIEIGILPSTDKKVIDAIDRYRATASTTEKLRALEELVGLNALKQVLFLLHRETDDATRKQLNQRRQIRGVASLAAKQALANDDIEEAIDLLRIAPQNAANVRSLAHVLKYSGRLNAEIKTTKKRLPAKDAQKWLLTLLRMNGDLEQARDLAKKTENKQAVATFAVLDGNPAPLLEHFKSRNSNPNHTIALNLLKRLHLRNDPTDIHEVIAELAKQIDGDTDEEIKLEYVTRVALLMGDRAVGEKLLKRYNNASALAYFSAQENSEQEFKLLGTPNPITQAKKFKVWMETEIERELDKDLALLAEQSSKIEDLAHFYFNRGELQQSLSILKHLLKSLLDDDNERWFNIIGELPMHGMSGFVAELASERGNEGGTYLRLSHEMFGNEPEVDLIWSMIKESHPDASDMEQFLSVLEVMGIHHRTKPNKQSDLSQIEARIEAKEGDERTDLLVALAYAAEIRNDFQAMLRYYKELCKDRELTEKREFHLKYQRAAEAIFDWQEIVTSYDLKPETYINNPTRLARYAIAKRKLGEKELADKLIEQATLRTLGETEELNELAAELHECGARKEAKAIWLEHISCLDAGGWGFYYTLNYINHQSRFAIAERNWKLASSFSLAEMIFLIEPSFRPSNYYTSLRNGNILNYTTGMLLLEKGDKSAALKLLEHAHDTLPGDGTLADDFFPSLMNTPLKKDAEKWFKESWNNIEKRIAAYPNDHNAHNTAAWFGARAGIKLDDSLRHARLALRTQSKQPAYLDTLAEIYFAKRDRVNAVKHSNKSLEHIKSGAYAFTRSAASSAHMYSELTQQNARFKNEAFPSR